MKSQTLSYEKVQAKDEKTHPSLFALTWPIFIEISLYMLMGGALIHLCSANTPITVWPQ
ncbi:hypothetical protein BsIDN1_19980 [Bacillus safensis]|uniref:Uncharacterized protein n=1 Tax=Bacillus safensis TaxID=561879 RepID=A0A5S9M466_BACIA|nr:hypothetical protein BsIDN1_19980 [Bacillus safensis]